MEEHLVSIIVPVYNVEEYIDRCVVSIILVDDGSTDRSGEICDKYQKRDHRIKVVHKENGGLSDARNVGIRLAVGEYMAFVDSDDYVHEEYISRMMEEAKRTNCDVVICGYTRKYVKREKEYYVNSSGTYGGKEIQKNFYGGSPSPEFFDVAWNKLYRSVLFENESFPKGKIHEDMFTVYRVLYLCGKICTITDQLYYYEQHEESISRTANYVEKTDRIMVEKERMEFYDRHGEERLFLLAQKAYFYLALKYTRDDMFSYPKRAEYAQTCKSLYKRMLFGHGYTFTERVGVMKAVIGNGRILRKANGEA